MAAHCKAEDKAPGRALCLACAKSGLNPGTLKTKQRFALFFINRVNTHTNIKLENELQFTMKAGAPDV